MQDLSLEGAYAPQSLNRSSAIVKCFSSLATNRGVTTEFEKMTTIKFLIALMGGAAVLLQSGCAGLTATSGPAVVTHPPVEGEALSAEYRVEVNGMNVPVYTAYVSEDARVAPLNLNDYYSFGSFEFSGPVEVTIHSSEPLSELNVRTVGREILAEIEGNVATFRLEQNGNFLIERNGNGRKDPLLLFANPLEEDLPNPDDPNVLFFGPGRHDAGVITLTDNQTLYIAGGAIVTGRVEARGDNIRILGRGLLENSTEEYNWKYIVLLNECFGSQIMDRLTGGKLRSKECLIGTRMQFKFIRLCMQVGLIRLRYIFQLYSVKC